jgi:hypothetical protein
MDRRDLNLETSILFRERKQRSTKPFLPDDSGDDAGPKRPKIDKPDTKELMRRMRRVDKDQSKRYRQRTGE